MIVMNEQMIPKKKPDATCSNECCLRIILLLPTKPETMSVRQSHHIGLKLNSSEKAIKEPATPASHADVHTYGSIDYSDSMCYHQRMVEDINAYGRCRMFMM